jgi:hypothetical protein
MKSSIDVFGSVLLFLTFSVLTEEHQISRACKQNTSPRTCV